MKKSYQITIDSKTTQELIDIYYNGRNDYTIEFLFMVEEELERRNASFTKMNIVPANKSSGENGYLTLILTILGVIVMLARFCAKNPLP